VGIVSDEINPVLAVFLIIISVADDFSYLGWPPRITANLCPNNVASFEIRDSLQGRRRASSTLL
jgi:hypothetical protein